MKSKEEKVRDMREALEHVANPRIAVHEAYKARMKDILWLFTNHLTDVMYSLPDDIEPDRSREIVMTFIDEFVEKSFVLGEKIIDQK